MRIIQVDKRSVVPAYKQIVSQVEMAILSKRLFKDDRLPSVNKVCLENGISRDTVFQAFDELKRRGIIYAIMGKGYFVKTVDFQDGLRYFLLFDELNAFKEQLFQAFISSLGGKAQIDFFFHHFNANMFRRLVRDAKGNYAKYILMPSNLEDIEDVIATLPASDVFILDQTRETLESYPAIYQNFADAMYQSLNQADDLLTKYRNYKLIFTSYKEPMGMVLGFKRFFEEKTLPYEIVRDLNRFRVEVGSVYVVPNDEDLVFIIEQCLEANYRIGTDVGLISYNDTALKRVVANGVTTISTDFAAMGQRLAVMVWEQESAKVENPSRLLLRKSL
jgi:DNA-binding transcriptional regulator YhcF (GntR family)